MAEQRTSRGVPLPSIGQIIVIAAALVAAWLVWSHFSRIADDGELSGRPVKGLRSVEAHLNRGEDALPDFLAALESGDAKERRQAAYGLGRIGPAAGEALAKLRERLADDDPRVRENAAYAVANIDPDKAAAAAAIAPLLADPQQSVRESAEKELLNLGSPAFNPVLELLQRDEATARLVGVRMFGDTHEAAYWRQWLDRHAEISEAVRRLVDDADAGVRIEALTLLAKWSQATLAEVGELLRSDDSRRVGVALSAASGMKEEAAELLPEIVVLLDRSPPVSILNTLNSMKAAARPAAPRLVKLAETSSSKDQLEIAKTLVAIDADPDDIAGILTPLLLVENKFGSHLGWRAGELLVEVNPLAARKQVSLLIPKLVNEQGTVDIAVLYVLHTLGQEAHEAVPVLIPLLNSSQPKVAEFAAHALNRAGLAGVKAAPDLTDVVKNGSRPFAQRLACADALASMGAGARTTVPTLLQVIAQPDPTAQALPTGNYMERHVRAAIITALGQIGGDDAGLVPALRSQLKSRSHDVRAAAADALGRVAGQSAEVLAELIPLLQADMPIIRAQAALAIGRSEVDRRAAVAPLIRLLADENPHVRLAAAIALGKIGPAARDALPVLQERLTVPFDPGRNDASQFLNIPELHKLSFEKAARTAIDAITGESKDGKGATEK